MSRRPLFVLLLLVAGSVSAQAYKWVDAHGTVHYSESAPPAGTKYSRVTLKGSVEPIAAPAPEATGDSGDSDSSAPSPEPSAPMRDTPENRAKLCTSLKSNLEALRDKGPVVMEQAGKSVALDTAQRKQQLDDAQAQYDKYCAQ